MEPFLLASYEIRVEIIGSVLGKRKIMFDDFEGKVSMNWMTIFFRLELELTCVNTNLNWNLHGKHELELELKQKTRIEIGIKTLNLNWNWN
jgi:hypothetical protein